MPGVQGSLKGRTALVTGANTGIGLVTARELARAGARVWIACRNQGKAEAAMQEIRQAVPAADLQFLALDLGNLAKVRQAAQTFLDSGEPLHMLVNNAGLAGSRGQTDDGFELAFGTNHLGPYLLTRLLLDRVKSSGGGRIVFVASRAHYRCKGIIWGDQTESTRTVAGLHEYGVSKLANVLTAKALAKRLTGTDVTTYSLHPGVVASDVWRRIPQPFRWLMTRFMITNDEGALTTLHCATSAAAAGETGLYYDKCAVKKPSRPARDEALAEELWQRSAAWVGLPA